MERHIAALSREQRRQGLDVTDVYNSGSPDGKSVRILPGLELHRLKPTIIRDLLFYGVAAWRLRHLRGEEFLVIHAHGHWSAALMARILGAWLGANAIALSVHGKISNRPLRWRIALGRKTLMFATGMEEVRFLKRVTGRQAFHLPSAPDERFFAPANLHVAACDIICVGNLYAVKNYPLLIELAARIPDRRFAIYGAGPALGELTARTSALGLENIEWRGPADIDTLRAAFENAGVLVNCSTSEGSPTSALEAMACGVPVILTPANDYSFLLEGDEAAVVLHDWSLNELEASVRVILANADRRSAMGRAARRIAIEHRWARKAEFVTDRMCRAVGQWQC